MYIVELIEIYIMKILLMKYKYVIRLFLLQLFCSSIIFVLSEVLYIYPSGYGQPLYSDFWDFVNSIPYTVIGISVTFDFLFLMNIVVYYYKNKIIKAFAKRINKFIFIFSLFSLNVFFYFVFLLYFLLKYPMWLEMIKIEIAMLLLLIYLKLNNFD